MLTLVPHSATPLVQQIVEGIQSLIENRTLASGNKLPSIRAFAASHSISTFTVVEAYDRLVAQGVLVTRGHSGFFVNRAAAAEDSDAEAPSRPEFNGEWYTHQIFENRHLDLKPGCGWLPNPWTFADGLRRAMRRVAAGELDLSGYGDPMGFPGLRTLVSQNLSQIQHIQAPPSQVLLTHGSSQALELAARTLIRPGDVVLVDDPGYPNLLHMLRSQGAVLAGVPRTRDGYDMAFLETVLAEARPVAFFTQPRLQSPTGSSASLPQLHQLLQYAQRHDFRLVENDIYADLDSDHQPSLASLDQLQRTLYIGSYSKSISPNIRAGYMLSNAHLMPDLLKLKLRSGLTSSEVVERIVYSAITDSRWRKHQKTLRQRLSEAHGEVAGHLTRLGFEIFCRPDEGMYLWARHPAIADSTALVEHAMREDIMLGPGQLFLAHPRPTGWMRFNVAFSLDPRLWTYLEARIAQAA